MYDIIPELHEYMESLLPERDPVLAEMEALARKERFPIIGPLAGRYLAQLVRTAGVRRVFELGSGFGYSAYWFARALPEDGKVICTDAKEENARLGMEYLGRGGLDHKVEYRVGDALEVFRAESGPQEFVFNDVDKEHYPEVFGLVVPRLRPGGIFVSDNVLWHGRVVETKDLDASTRAVKTFNSMMFENPAVHSVIVPIRDGLGVCLKI